MNNEPDIDFSAIRRQASGRLHYEPARELVAESDVSQEHVAEHQLMELLKSKGDALNVATLRAPDGGIYYDTENTGFKHIPVPNPLPPITNDLLREDRELMQHQKDIIEKAQARKFFVGDFPDADTGKTLDAPLVPIPVEGAHRQTEDRVHRRGVTHEGYQQLIADAARAYREAVRADTYDERPDSVLEAQRKLLWLVDAERHRWSPSQYPEDTNGT